MVWVGSSFLTRPVIVIAEVLRGGFKCFGPWRVSLHSGAGHWVRLTTERVYVVSKAIVHHHSFLPFSMGGINHQDMGGILISLLTLIIIYIYRSPSNFPCPSTADTVLTPCSHQERTLAVPPYQPGQPVLLQASLCCKWWPDWIKGPTGEFGWICEVCGGYIICKYSI